jgi:hypothetical protein
LQPAADRLSTWWSEVSQGRRANDQSETPLFDAGQDHADFRVPGPRKSAVLRVYEKSTTFLQLEAVNDNLKDFGLKKSLDNGSPTESVLGSWPDPSPIPAPRIK